MVGLWLLLVAVTVLLERNLGVAVETCLFHRATGWPCPTCGTTRAVLAVSRGALGEAFRLNPGVMTLFSIGVLHLLVRAATARSFSIEPLPGGRLVLGVGVALVLANWAWVIRTLR